MRRGALFTLALAVGVAACSPGSRDVPPTPAGESSTAATSGSALSASTTPTTTATTPAAVEWELIEPHLEAPPPVAGRDDIEFPPAQLMQVVLVGDSVVGVGRGQEGFAAWRSRDGIDWDLTYYEPFSPHGDSDHLLTWGGELLLIGERRLVAVGTVSAGRRAPIPNLAPATVVWVSDDGGATWRRARWPEEGSSLVYHVEATRFGLVAVGDVRPNEPEPGPMNPAVWISPDDGENWYPADRGQEAFTGEGGVTRVIDLGGELLAVGSVDDRTAVWRSADGEVWARTTPEAFGAAGCDDGACYVGGWVNGLARFEGMAVALGALWDPDTGTYPPSFWESTDGLNWARWAGDPAFGDGEDCRLGNLTVWRDRLLVWGTITERSDPQFCFQDLATCEQRSIVVNLGDSGDWRRLALEPPLEALIVDIAVGPHRLMIVTEGGWEGDPPQTIYLWEGTAGTEPEAVAVTAPTTTTPAFPLLDPSAGSLEEGVTWRYVYAFQGCYGDYLHFNGRTWKRLEDLPIQAHWPVRHVSVIDAPTELLYGTITLVTPDRIEIRVEGGDLVAAFVPTEEEAPFCW